MDWLRMKRFAILQDPIVHPTLGEYKAEMMGQDCERA